MRKSSISLTHDGRGIRFDIYFEDEENVLYDIEMQTSYHKSLPKRARYYQGMIDLNSLSKGKRFRELKDSYIIFICTFDVFEKKRSIYSFENICSEDTSIRLNDGVHKIFLCTGGETDDTSEKMRVFLHYISCYKADGDFSKRLEAEVEKARINEKWRLDYMTLQEKFEDKFEEGLEKGIEQGKAEGEKEREQLASRIEALEAELKNTVAL